MDKKLKVVIENCPQNHKCPAVRVCPVRCFVSGWV